MKNIDINNLKNWENFGDINFFEYGVLVKKTDSAEVFRILYCLPHPEEENIFLFADCEVDITANWINRNAVMNYGGITAENYNAVYFAISCIGYYGVEEFKNLYIPLLYTKEEVMEVLENLE